MRLNESVLLSDINPLSGLRPIATYSILQLGQLVCLE